MRIVFPSHCRTSIETGILRRVSDYSLPARTLLQRRQFRAVHGQQSRAFVFAPNENRAVEGDFAHRARRCAQLLHRMLGPAVRWFIDTAVSSIRIQVRL